MRLGQDVLRDLPTALRCEWLLANGIGGSASGTAAGAHARRSHAWLTASGVHGRPIVLLLGTADRVRTPAGTFDLSGAPAPSGGARPAGHQLLESFELDPLPAWTFEAGGARIERSLFAISGHHAIAVRWRLVSGPLATLTVSPLIVTRAPDALEHSHGGIRGASQSVPGRVRVEMDSHAGALTLWHNGAFLPARVWRPFEHAAGDDERREEAFVPGYLEATLEPGAELIVVAATREDLFRELAREDRLGSPPPRTLADCCDVLVHRERDVRARWIRPALIGADLTAQQARIAHAGANGSAEPGHAPLLDVGDGWTEPMAAVLLAGLTRRGHRLTAVSTLPGATERGEHALRIVPGLLALRAFEPAREILRGYVEYLDEGVAPESFDEEDGTPRYDSPAPSLWLVHAGELYARRSGDVAFAKSVLYPACEAIVQFFRAGTKHGIRVDDEGLLEGGAKRERRADVNALWYHALVAMAQLARTLGHKESGAFHLAWARDHQQSFLARFWDNEAGAPYLRLEADGGEGGLRPSLALAASLSPSLLPQEWAERLVATLESELLTPWGLRLEPGSNEVSPAWLGPFASAWLRARGRTPKALAAVRGWFDHLREARVLGLESAPPERFELGARGAAPRPAGDPFSVLAAAELLRAWVEDVEHVAADVRPAARAAIEATRPETLAAESD